LISDRRVMKPTDMQYAGLRYVILAIGDQFVVAPISRLW
jgi:hypothetical protein